MEKKHFNHSKLMINQDQDHLKARIPN
jgi:hypothetical protein